MNSWVHLFSKFTPEALLFEALLILTLCGGYAAFWVLRKRRLGVIEQDVPSTVVKDYLNQLIVDAEALRAQLFGLLASAGVKTDGLSRLSNTQLTAALSAASTSMDPALLQKLAALEAKMAEQASALDSITDEKTRLEQELAAARANAGDGSAGAGGGADSAELANLREQLQNLEAKLAEYSVIEDDLANLKRLQQENSQLKAALANAGGASTPAAQSAPAPAAAASPAASAPAAPAPTPAAATAPAGATAAFSAPPAAATPQPDFDALVGEVESSLKANPSAAASGGDPKTDEDLIAEFEKMLNG